jgi:hypothetical protein
MVGVRACPCACGGGVADDVQAGSGSGNRISRLGLRCVCVVTMRVLWLLLVRARSFLPVKRRRCRRCRARQACLQALCVLGPSMLLVCVVRAACGSTRLGG